MLVLSRNAGQQIRVGDIVITVVQTRKGSVKLGITAPPDVPIHRDDIKSTEPNNGSTKRG